MKIKMILPALTEALSPLFRPIKYSLFPPLGLATLAGYLDDDDDIELIDEHVQSLCLDDEPDLVVIEVYITAARRAYEIADNYRSRGIRVCLGGLHVTALPDEAQVHADTIFLGPGEDTWPTFLADLQAGRAKARYASTVRTLHGAPRPRRDLIDRHRYLVPNSIVVSRGCPHRCEFCYGEAFYKGGKRFYTMLVDDALAEIVSLRGKHLFFLDDNIMADEQFALALFDGMRGMNRVWQAAATVQTILKPGLIERAAEVGLRSLFVGFETLNDANLRAMDKLHNDRSDYDRAIRKLRDHGIMINASFVFGMDADDADVFDRTTAWAVQQGIETATFHILTPYPGTKLYERMARQGRLLTDNWDMYDTRHTVFRPARMTPDALEAGYWRAYRQFYSWSSILAASGTKSSLSARLRHLAYTGAWKKLEPMWNLIIKCGGLTPMAPLLELILAGPRRRGKSRTSKAARTPWVGRGLD